MSISGFAYNRNWIQLHWPQDSNIRRRCSRIHSRAAPSHGTKLIQSQLNQVRRCQWDVTNASRAAQSVRIFPHNSNDSNKHTHSLTHSLTHTHTYILKGREKMREKARHCSNHPPMLMGWVDPHHHHPPHHRLIAQQNKSAKYVVFLFLFLFFTFRIFISIFTGGWGIEWNKTKKQKTKKRSQRLERGGGRAPSSG